MGLLVPLSSDIVRVGSVTVLSLRLFSCSFFNPIPQDENLPSHFIRIRDSSTRFLRDVVTGIILVGRETTLSAINWFFWILSSRPHMCKKIHDEIKSVQSTSRSVGTCLGMRS
ncbi:hypothetical protein VNO78_11870 [Psophocarpus tetragonolobus]|uniref:Cytochrome P450 n=1 Tax=Psophocarpus tetragonolobus TaxID=3891 RepID=A0AAN9SQ12_PSOTE